MSETQRVGKRVEIKADELRKNKFFIATPCYGGQLTEPYFRSTVKALNFFNKHNVPLAFGTIANESLVMRARNVLVSFFLNSDYTHLLFVDADIEYEVESILKLYAADKDVVVGLYPKKGLNWNGIKQSILDNPKHRFTDEEMAAFGADYAANFKYVSRKDRTIRVENGLIEMHDASTGFMMIKREAILKMIEAYPELKYKNDVNLKNAKDTDNFYALFDTMIDEEDGRFLSEDYSFCRRFQEIGGKIWADPSISLNHYGHFKFAGNPNCIIEWNTPKIPLENIKTIELPD